MRGSLSTRLGRALGAAASGSEIDDWLAWLVSQRDRWTVQWITTSGGVTVPAAANDALVGIKGPGGCSGTNANVAGGGGAGCCLKRFQSPGGVTLTFSLGTVEGNFGSYGGNGTNSTVSELGMVAGAGGPANSWTPGSGGTATGGDVNLAGGAGGLVGEGNFGANGQGQMPGLGGAGASSFGGGGGAGGHPLFPGGPAYPWRHAGNGSVGYANYAGGGAMGLLIWI